MDFWDDLRLLDICLNDVLGNVKTMQCNEQVTRRLTKTNFDIHDIIRSNLTWTGLSRARKPIP